MRRCRHGTCAYLPPLPTHHITRPLAMSAPSPLAPVAGSGVSPVAHLATHVFLKKSMDVLVQAARRGLIVCDRLRFEMIGYDRIS